MTRRKTDEERLAALLEQQEKINRKVEEINEKVKEENRTARTSYLINVGGWVLAALGCGGTDVEEGELGQEWTRVDSGKLRKVLTTALMEKQSDVLLPEKRLIRVAKAEMRKVSRQPLRSFMDDGSGGSSDQGGPEAAGTETDTDAGPHSAGEPAGTGQGGQGYAERLARQHGINFSM